MKLELGTKLFTFANKRFQPCWPLQVSVSCDNVDYDVTLVMTS